MVRGCSTLLLFTILRTGAGGIRRPEKSSTEMTDHVALRVVAVAMLLGGSLPLFSSSRAFGQAAAPAAGGGAAPSSSPKASGQQAPPAAAGATAPTGATGPTDAPIVPPATAASVKSQCETRVARLVGKDAAALRDPEVKALAKSAPSIAICAAVVRDSDEPCDLLPEDQAKSCRKTRFTYHELRDPKSRGYVFTDVEYRDCKASKEYESLCDPLRDALRAGDPEKCPSKQPFGAMCRASIALDPTLCPADDKDCKKDIEKYKVYAKGLQGLKTSGGEDQRALAAAALGEADACKPVTKPVLDACGVAAAAITTTTTVPGGTPPPAATPPAKSGGPSGTPAPKAAS